MCPMRSHGWLSSWGRPHKGEGARQDRGQPAVCTDRAAGREVEIIQCKCKIYVERARVPLLSFVLGPAPLT